MKIADLIATYIVDADSPFHPLRHATKQGYLRLLKRLETDIGDREAPDIVGAISNQDHRHSGRGNPRPTRQDEPARDRRKVRHLIQLRELPSKRKEPGIVRCHSHLGI